MRVLAVSAAERSADSLYTLCKDMGVETVTSALSAAAGRRYILDEEWDVLLINSPLLDEDALTLARMADETASLPTVLLVRESEYQSVGLRAQKAGLIVVTKPIIRPMLLQALHIAEGLRTRDRAKNERLKQLENKIEEIKLISRAKLILVERRGLSEREAHLEIEQRAMSRRVKALTIAQEIISGYMEN